MSSDIDRMRGRRSAPETPRPPKTKSKITRVFECSDKNPELVQCAGPTTEDADADALKESLLKIVRVDFKSYLNAFTHNTLDYDKVRTLDPKESHAVLRRGQEFATKIYFNRPYNKESDDMTVVLTFGSSPRQNNGTEVVLPLSGESSSKNWSVKIYCQKDNSISLKIQIPARCCVGKWNLMVKTSPKKKDGQQARLEWKSTKPIYILFNPWCKKDPVFNPDEAFRKEYVLAERGRIYTGGNHYIPRFREWNFAQFDEPVLDCVLWVLDNRTPELKAAARSNPVQVARKLTSVLNSLDNRGILSGNWSGDYEGGTSPSAWTGSLGILKEFYQSKCSVNFGQCWVFSGVLTTCLRALGIPGRSVTNFSSAHDTDCSLTIDRYLTVEGKRDKSLTWDSIWNFHVWNDAWMSRPDLKGEYALAGWQACDATPQETSNGTFCCGPFPVAAIKEGHLDMPYDGPFIFSEVNGDVVYWQLQEDFTYKCKRIEKDSVGDAVLTYRANDNQMDDVTHDYKYADAKQERLVMKRACQNIDEANVKDITIYDDITVPESDVELKFEKMEPVMYGNTYSVALTVKNVSKEKRNVTVTLGSRSFDYTGVFHKKVMSKKFQDKLNPGEVKTFKEDVPFDQYDPDTVEKCNFQNDGTCKVMETGETEFLTENFDLLKPNLSVMATSDVVKLGQKVNVEISFKNPLPVSLSQCTLDVEGVGLQEPRKFKIPGTVNPKDTFKFEFDVHPFKARLRKECCPEVIVNFNSKQMCDVQGSCKLNVETASEKIVDSDDEN